ncbi:MAG: hypothetical protein ACFB9M_01460 [Myxococcota bacterium]
MTLALVSSTLRIEIPGTWPGGVPPSEEIRSLVQRSAPAQVQIEPPSETLTQTFHHAAPFVDLSEAQLEAVGRHSARLTVTRTVGPRQVEPARQLLQATRVLPRGSLGVHVATVGKVHGLGQWTSWWAASVGDLLEAYVLFGWAPRPAPQFRTWGMQAFGLPDVVCEFEGTPNLFRSVAEAFVWERLIAPDSAVSDTFILGKGVCPPLAVLWRPMAQQPFGAWRLVDVHRGSTQPSR